MSTPVGNRYRSAWAGEARKERTTSTGAEQPSYRFVCFGWEHDESTTRRHPDSTTT